MPDSRISPGLVTATGGRLLTRLRDQADMNRAAIERIRAVPPLKKPAVLTGRAFDSVTGFWNYSWTEQGYDERGLRYTKPGGQSGTTTWNPAVAYGDGTLPTTFPQEVTIRRRGLSASRGVLWEFPWYCACEMGTGSGSGGGDGGVLTTCCANRIPRDLYGTFYSTPACTCWDAISVKRFDWDGGSSTSWSYHPDFGMCSTTTVTEMSLFCSSGVWGFAFSSIGDCIPIASSITVTCIPFSALVKVTLTGGSCSACAGSDLYIIITG